MLIYTSIMPDWVIFLGYRVAKRPPASPDAGGLGTAFLIPTINSGSRSGGWVGVCSLSTAKPILVRMLTTVTYCPHNYLVFMQKTYKHLWRPVSYTPDSLEGWWYFATKLEISKYQTECWCLPNLSQNKRHDFNISIYWWVQQSTK